MELWIRSQDREKLIKVKSLYVEKYPSSNNRYAIYNFFYDDLDDCDIPLGTYETRERALEVLDEIQNILKPIIKIKYEYDDSQPIMNGEWLKSLKEESKIEELSTYVYEMPKE